MSRSSQIGFTNIKSSITVLKGKTLPKCPEGRRLEGRINSLSEDARVRDIANRWAFVREQFDKNRKNRVEALEEYLNDFERRIAEVVSDIHVNKQKKAFQDLLEILADVQADIERLDEKQQKACSLIEETCREMVQEMKTGQSKWEADLVLQIDEKLISLNNGFLKAKKIHSDQLENDVTELNNSIYEIKESIVEEKNQREDGSEHIVARVQTELEKLEEDITIEQKVREETSEKIKTLITEMEAKLERDIEQEAKEREQTNTSLLTLLEEACSRIERTFNSDL